MTRSTDYPSELIEKLRSLASFSIEPPVLTEYGVFNLPTSDLLTQPPKHTVDDELDLDKVQTALRTYNIVCSAIDVIRGPRISKYIMSPLSMPRFSTIRNIQNEIAFKLRVEAVRVVPNNQYGTLEIEVPNKVDKPLYLSEVTANCRDEDKVALPAGVNTNGLLTKITLAEAPHLLVAGTTGSGKSMFLNQLICSVLVNYRPTEVQLCLIDLKRGVEFGPYEGVPHLLTPNSYSPEEAAYTIESLKALMDNRYRTFGMVARDISSYNEVSENKMPRVMVVIDELAALVASLKTTLEDIIWIAQLGRAAGIHLVLATQHPSRDILTGRLKANIASRVAFATSSAIDSRVILDRNGAENLTGNGDALLDFGKHTDTRIQTAFVPVEDINALTKYWSNYTVVSRKR